METGLAYRITASLACVLALVGCGGGQSSGVEGDATGGTPGVERDVTAEAPAVIVHCDTNRDGRLDDADLDGRHSWSWESGAFILANLDDDDGSGLPDALDRVVNGQADETDLARCQVLFDSSLITENAKVFVEVSVQHRVRPANWFVWPGSDPGIPVNVFAKTGTEWVFVDRDTPLRLSDGVPLVLGVEAKTFAGIDGWDGMLRLHVSLIAEDGRIFKDFAKARVAPWLMLPNSAPTRTLYIASGIVDNAHIIRELRDILPHWGVGFPPPRPAADGRELWLQDTMEIGYTEIPGGGRMHVVLNGIRGADTFGPTLLGPDIGVITVGTVRNLKGHDQWADWFGNLEVSHPTAQYPLGRIYYGKNVNSGIGLHPEVVAFLEAQVVQKPFWVDTSWLAIKHVDELFSFIPGNDGRGMVLRVSPEAAVALTGEPLDDFNRGIVDSIHRMLHGGVYTISGDRVDYPGLIALLGIDESRIIPLPALFSPVAVDGALNNRPGAFGQWSNPANSVFLNGNILIGGTEMPGAVQADITAKLHAAGVNEVVFIDDRVYHERSGNVHCMVNSLHEAPVTGFWTRLP